MKIYLDEPITLFGIKVGHTEQGLKVLIDHYEEMLARANIRTELMGEKERQHCKWLIDNLKQHLQLYERQRNTTTGTTPENK